MPLSLPVSFPLGGPPAGPPRVVPSTSSASAEELARTLGSDIDSFTQGDLSQHLQLLTGSPNLAQALANRLQTPRGGLFYDADYGKDIRSYLNASLTPRVLAQMQADAQAECLKDDRVLGCSAAASVLGSGNSLTVKLALNVTTASGPFTFVLSVTSLSVSVIG
jgi:hypothetical protein